MLKTYKATVLGALLLFGAAGCADLEVTNPNDADRGRALRTAGDVESLIAGSFSQWWEVTSDYYGQSMFLSAASFQHSASWNNACMVPCSTLPRQELVNDVAWVEYRALSNAWTWSYRALAAIGDGLRALDTNEEFVAELGADNTLRVRAYGRFVQGLAHGAIALLYDKGFVVDETTDVNNLGEPLGYNEMMTAALGYFDQAIQLASGASFTIPAAWTSQDVTADELVRLAHAFRAQFRAAVARNPSERAAVDWDEVLADVNAGISEDWGVIYDFDLWYSDLVDWAHWPGYGWLDYFIYGMADQSGDYEAWLSLPVGERHPQPAADPIRIVTPDTRFPQGATIAEQLENPGSRFEVATTAYLDNITEQWNQPARGTWRWSWYRAHEFDDLIFNGNVELPLVSVREQRLLAAEAYYHKNQLDLAANIVNETRTVYGLNATDASETNTNCVPKLPNGDCGDLFEMLKWEKRMEARFRGTLGTPWYFDSRGWGDLYAGTALQLAMPCGELQILQAPCYNTGGGAEASAPVSTYAWPGES